MLKKILYFLLAIVVVILIGLAVLRFLPAENVSKKNVDYTLAAVTLFEEYTTDEQVANAKYIGKILEVEGAIEDIMTDENNATVVLLRANEMGNGILCTLIPSENTKNLRRGNQVRIKGRCTGMLMDVVMNKCTIISD